MVKLVVQDNIYISVLAIAGIYSELFAWWDVSIRCSIYHSWYIAVFYKSVDSVSFLNISSRLCSQSIYISILFSKVKFCYSVLSHSPYLFVSIRSAHHDISSETNIKLEYTSIPLTIHTHIYNIFSFLCHTITHSLVMIVVVVAVSIPVVIDVLLPNIASSVLQIYNFQ